MSSKLATQIKELTVEPGSLAIFWLAQAGFVYKTSGGTIVYVDAYLSDCVHRMLSDVRYGFKRIMPAPLAPEEVEADVVVCTHSHADHFDYDAIPVLARHPRIHFVAAPDCRMISVPPDPIKKLILNINLILDHALPPSPPQKDLIS